MVARQQKLRVVVIGLTFALPISALIGCNKTPAAGSGSTAQSGNGSAVFTANCSKCHSINGVGAKRGPDLTHVGAEAEHTAEWLTEFIKNPNSKKPGSRMPAFEGKISESDLTALTEYLVSLK